MAALLHPRHGVEVLLGVALLMLVLRTFVACGVVEPVVVHGSSMAPTLWGERFAGRCPSCDDPLTVGVDQAREAATLECPACESGRIQLSQATRLPADALWVNRLGAAPDRWELVVLRCPHDAQSLLVKRVVGLPGEKIEFRQGYLWVDGERCVKPLVRQLELRRLEHCERDRQRRWTPRSGEWRWVNQAWQGEGPSNQTPAELVYLRPVFDDFGGNPHLSRRFNPQPDLMIEVLVQASPGAVWEVGIAGYRARFNSGERRVLLTVFDSRPLLAVDGKRVRKLPKISELAAGAAPLRFECWQAACDSNRSRSGRTSTTSLTPRQAARRATSRGDWGPMSILWWGTTRPPRSTAATGPPAPASPSG